MSFGQITVLHVDDDPQFGELTKAMLEREDETFDVISETNPHEVAELLEQRAIDCLVSDYDMPGMNGIELLEQIREDNPALPVILFTGKGTEAVASRAISAGVTDYLQKEGRSDQYTVLANRIHNAVEHRINERKREQYQAVVETAGDAMYVLDEEGYIEIVNKAFERRSGYDREELLGNHVSGFLSPEAINQGAEAIQSLLQAKDRESERFTFRGPGPDGEERLYETTLSLVNQSSFAGSVGIVRDITEQKKREQELERYEQLAEYSPDFLTVLDEDLTVTYQSPPSPLFEWEPKDMSPDNPLEHIHPDDNETVLENFSELVQNPEAVVTTEFRAEDVNGEWQWVESRGQNFTDDGEIAGILTAMRRITDRKRQKKQLTRYSETLEQLQRSTQTLVEATDAEEAATHAIETFEDVLDFHVAGLWLSTPDREALEPVASSEQGKEIVPDLPTYSAKTQSLSWEAYQEQNVRYIRDMSEHEERSNPDTPIQSEVIVPLGRYGLVNIGSTDADAFTDHEISLIELWADTLTVAFAQITQFDLLQEREEELRRERDRLDEFAGVISHDLRNPLNVATGRIDLAAKECDSEHLTDVVEALSRMEAMIDDLLLLAQQGKTVGEREQIVLEELGSGCWGNIDTSDATITIDGKIIFAADRSQVKQALENLFRNAIDHGGESVTVTVGVLNDKNGFYVSDDGPGIPQEDRGDVFDSGFSTHQDGIGFGLAIVKRICEAHGWQISVTESKAGGARFEITGIESLES